MRRLLFAIPVLFAIIIIGYLLFGLGRDAKLLPSVLLDKPVPTMEIGALYPDLPAITHANLSDANHYKLVNVFASWCAPCRLEHGFLKQLGKNPNIKLFGINWKDTTANADKYLNELGNPYHAISADTDGRYSVEWGVYGVPENFLIDKNGVIIWKFVGALTQKEVDSINSLMR